MTANRNPVKRWFVTFPNSCESLTDKRMFEAAMPPYEFYSCCEEDHKSGKKHLHACLILKKALSQSKLLKYIGKSYPAVINSIHVRPVRDLENTLDYIRKEDAEYVEIGDFKKKIDGLTKKQRELENWFIVEGYWKKNWRDDYNKKLERLAGYAEERKEREFMFYGT